MSKQLQPTSWSRSICDNAKWILYKRCRKRMLKKPVHFEQSAAIAGTLPDHPDTKTFFGVDYEGNVVDFSRDTSEALWTIILPIIDSLQFVVCKVVYGWRMNEYIAGPEWDYGWTVLNVYRVDARFKKCLMRVVDHIK